MRYARALGNSRRVGGLRHDIGGRIQPHKFIAPAGSQTSASPSAWARGEGSVEPSGGFWCGPQSTLSMGYTGPLTNVVQVTTDEGATDTYTCTVHTAGNEVYLPVIMKNH